MSGPRFVAWLDRDGTIVDDPGYLDDPDALVLLPGAAEAVARLKAAGALVVLVTNQSGIARGYVDRATVDRIHEKLRAALRDVGGDLDHVELCPHLPAELWEGPGEPCRCRKPGPLMIERARERLGLEGVPGVVVGDKAADLGLARAVGLPAVLVRTGDGRATEDSLDALPEHVADDLSGAVDWILENFGRR